MYLHSTDAYADKIIDELDESSQQVLRGITDEGDLSLLHHTWGQAIRNEFGLWQPDHPLTWHWHQNGPGARHLVNGIDHSPDHPDAVSMEIMKKVWRKVRA